MPLVDVELPEPSDAALPARVVALLSAAEVRIAEFFDRRRGEAVAGFVHSDFDRVARALRAIAEARLAPGDACCEWGSGFGIVAMTAACFEFRACGIEIDADLVAEADQLATELELDVEFVCGTFVPPGGDDLTDVPQEFGWFSAGGSCGHDALRADPSDFDLIFAYPWPGEDQVIEDLFERYAASSALLLTYHGYEDLRLRRKEPSGSSMPRP